MLGHDRIGTGPIRVIVMNDWMADTSTWDGARRYLDLDAFTWVFADLRGYGRSKALEGPFDLGQSVTDILALADTLGWPQFNIVGHSMSTLVAMHLAQHHGVDPGIVEFEKPVAADDFNDEGRAVDEQPAAHPDMAKRQCPEKDCGETVYDNR